MPFQPAAGLPRCAVVDLGSNSVRLVVFEGVSRNPVAIFNEKAVLRLGRGLETTGHLNEIAMAQAKVVMRRYHAVAQAMGAGRLEVLATAAVRDARNGADFVAAIQQMLPDSHIKVLSGEEEAALSADGVLCGIPTADGVLADIGGGSLELVRLQGGRAHSGQTLSLGVIRLAERSGSDLVRARAIVEADLAAVPWLAEGAGGDLYIVGGAWRAFARIHMAQTGYPLNIVHHYTIKREEARDLTALIAGSGRRALERLPGVPRRRIDDLPIAAVVLRRLLRSTGIRRVVFSASGLREGWLLRRMPDAMRNEDPLIAAAREACLRSARDPAFPPSLAAWTDQIFAAETAELHRLRLAACWLSDTGSHDHPEYRAEQSFARVLRQPGIGFDHHARAFLALAIAMRYEAEPDAAFLTPARLLLDAGTAQRATALGSALRLAYTLSGGTTDLLDCATLTANGTRLTLKLIEGSGLFAGESISRRLDALALALGLDPATFVV